jgi:hypothetical protein
LFWSFKRSGFDCESTHRQRMNFIYVESKAKLLSSRLLRSYQVYIVLIFTLCLYIHIQSFIFIDTNNEYTL